MSKSIAEQNRERYPEMAKRVDEIREVFGNVRVLSFTPNTASTKQDDKVQSSAENATLTTTLISSEPIKKLSAKELRAHQKQVEIRKMIAAGQIKLGC